MIIPLESTKTPEQLKDIPLYNTLKALSEYSKTQDNFSAPSSYKSKMLSK